MALLPGLLTASPHLEAEVWALPKVERMVPLRELWITASQQIPPASPRIARPELLLLCTAQHDAADPQEPFILSYLRSGKREVGQVCKACCGQLAVNVWGQRCTCWANPWATSGDFTHWKDENSNKQARSSQEEKGDRGLLWPHR